jgi:hypothetical protein
MFVVETSDAGTLRKSCILMGVSLALLGSFGAILTMHTYVKRLPIKDGFRVFGFRLTRE